MAHLKEVEATFSCDGCSKPITVDLDAAWQTEGWSVFDYALDAVRAGFNGSMASVQGTDNDKVLCGHCTRIVDAFVTEDRNATDDEIDEALA